MGRILDIPPVFKKFPGILMKTSHNYKIAPFFYASYELLENFHGIIDVLNNLCGAYHIILTAFMDFFR